MPRASKSTLTPCLPTRSMSLSRGSGTAQRRRPHLGLPVKVSYLEFGIGTTRHDIGMTKVDLPAKGAAGCPAFARVGWHTPSAPGHYCLQVELLWDDDAEPAQQHGPAQHRREGAELAARGVHVPGAQRPPRAPRQITLELDAYAIPPLAALRRATRHARPARPPPPRGVAAARRLAGERRPERRLALAAGETAQVTVDITSPDGYEGRQAINVQRR